MLELMRRLISHVSHYDAELPYNLNWSISSWTPLEQFLTANPLRVIDIGARGGAPPELATLRHYIDYVGFDADRGECDKINRSPPPGYRSYRVYNTFLAGSPGPRRFNLYRRRGESSIYEPDVRFQELYGGEVFAPEESVTVEGSSLDAVMRQNEPGMEPDLLKIDTQGSELEILHGATDLLRTVSMVEVEVEFIPMYEGQPLFDDVLRCLRAEGFELLYLNRVFSCRRQVYQGPSRGQIIFGDALFGRTDAALEAFTASKLAKYIVMLVQYGHRDIAYQLSTARPDALALIPGIRQVMPFSGAQGLRTKAARAFFMQLDKCLALGLHLRKYNQRCMDSDRSWPLR